MQVRRRIILEPGKRDVEIIVNQAQADADTVADDEDDANDDGSDAHGDDDDIYIMVECILYVTKK